MALSGRFRSALIIGGQGIRARKLRTLLSMVSLFLGVLAVVTVQAGAEIANRALLTDIELGMGKDGTVVLNLPTHEATVPVMTEVLRGRPEMVGLTSTMAIIGEPSVMPINPGGSPLKYAGQGYGGAMMVCDQMGCHEQKSDDGPPPPGKAIELRLVGLTGDIRQYRPFHAEAGRWLDFSGEPSLSPGLVLNREAAAAFTQHRIPAEMRIEGSTANPTPRVLGVVHDGDSSPAAYVRADELLNWTTPATGNQNGRNSFAVYMPPGVTDVEQTLRARLAARGAPADQIHAYQVESKKEIESQLTLMRMIFLAMAVLVLLIGVAGILNVGLATVGERVEEFALRRAVGTPRLLLAGIVLSETLIIGMLTAGAAIGVGAVGLKLAPMVLGGRFETMGADLAFPWQAGVAGVIAGLAAGVLGGLLPAIRAARIPIATVMRA
ncbi:putative ABC transport system permease protein [Actinokineospora alba]|uniref:Putative ABC transport system permease protein n=1 Tax=Actinokineospora alba TaxID=504798 RepID=A0A1H0HVB9_9PSEU|nr:ABC transporter permease [Actinokineospora alba]TDP64729.1 putative ABC transport system permease protein [Actinokineospora alba]SDH44322.1 putative ABC transport system permease protein [Actinokineospora alba]SDO23103.1 putative ABC transport system permease protein [Actinokineospora alba]